MPLEKSTNQFCCGSAIQFTTGNGRFAPAGLPMTSDAARISGFGVPLRLVSRYNGEIPWLRTRASQSDFSDDVAGE
jgi:hypothetical protein